MEKLLKNINEYVIQEIDDKQRLQYINARSDFNTFLNALSEAKSIRGGMFWKSQNGNEYLIRTSASNSQTSLGPKSTETQAIYDRFTEKKAKTLQYIKHAEQLVYQNKRMNRALYVGRTPQIVVDVLNEMRERGLEQFFTVVGTHAIYAYESEAGVRINNADALATKDVDFLFDTRKSIQFASAVRRLDSSVLGVLQKVDPSFKLHHEQKYTAVNKNGFEVDFIRREVKQTDDQHPMRLTDHEEDFWVVQAKNADVLLDSEPFYAMVVSTSGDMARMKTVNPYTFVSFKRWMAELPGRDALKKPRDKVQADIVEALITQYFPHLKKPPSKFN
jgi:hypothetical protein